MAITKYYPIVLARYPSALQRLEILHNLGRAPAMLDAYVRGQMYRVIENTIRISVRAYDSTKRWNRC
jgi:hypothetical protein